jgi:uncharacterized protein (TIGR02246 family)
MDALTGLIEREAIRDLLARYAMAFDDRDWDAWEALWTDDVVFVVDGAPIEGLAALKEFTLGCLPQEYVSKHFLGPSIVELGADGRTASARTDVVWIAANYNNQIVARYVDTLVKTEAGWQISRREEWAVPFRPGPPPMSDAAVALSGAFMRQEEPDA